MRDISTFNEKKSEWYFNVDNSWGIFQLSMKRKVIFLIDDEDDESYDERWRVMMMNIQSSDISINNSYVLVNNSSILDNNSFNLDNNSFILNNNIICTVKPSHSYFRTITFKLLNHNIQTFDDDYVVVNMSRVLMISWWWGWVWIVDKDGEVEKELIIYRRSYI